MVAKYSLSSLIKLFFFIYSKLTLYISFSLNYNSNFSFYMKWSKLLFVCTTSVIKSKEVVIIMEIVYQESGPDKIAELSIYFYRFLKLDLAINIVGFM